MARIRIQSVEDPFDRPELGHAATDMLGLADAMGLLREERELRVLGWETVRTAAAAVARAGIATALAPRLASATDPEEATELLHALTEILRESPVPEREWGRLKKLFPSDELARLLGVSATSVARYSSHARKTPDPVAARLHFLARIVRHLEGAYNERGVRRWFQRPRAALEGMAPSQVLTGEWDPDGEGPMRVLGLARSLSAVAST